VPGQQARSVLVTHATQYTGPGAVAALRDQGMRVFCHDLSFGDASAPAAFLASGRSGFVTGQTIHFTGGWP
jgi:NAD(P)-dependent dehydrogenase (short-subunit alcohol dehydrogenase family)